jgi:hypothetical protein
MPAKATATIVVLISEFTPNPFCSTHVFQLTVNMSLQITDSTLPVGCAFSLRAHSFDDDVILAEGIKFFLIREFKSL